MNSNYFGMGGRFIRSAIFVIATLIGMQSFATSVAARIPATVTVLHSFGTDFTDGIHPNSIVRGVDGSLYGTTCFGGSMRAGMIFRVSPSGNTIVLHTFGAVVNDPRNPDDLILGPAGDFYGTSERGGLHDSGTLFKMTPAGVVTILYSFGTRALGVPGSLNDTTNGYCPIGVIRGSDGNFYVTASGGTAAYGVVTRITPTGIGTPLHSFGDARVSNDGTYPAAKVIQGSDGNLYGTTLLGGEDDTGTVFRLTTAGVETVLHSFGDGTVANDGYDSVGPLLQTSPTTFCGTTFGGGTDDSGTVFSISTDGDETVIHSFGDGSVEGDGRSPASGLLETADGSLYGTTAFGGSTGYGSLYMLNTAHVLTRLHSFNDGTIPDDGWYPSGIVQGAGANFFGIAANGGLNYYGTLYKLTLRVPLPSVLSATAGNGSAALSWSSGSATASYNLYKGEESGHEGAIPAAVRVETTSYRVSGLANGKTYYFTLADVNAAGTSEHSNEVAVKPKT